MATLTINFTAPIPAPSLGYKVVYKAVGSSTNITLNVSSPLGSIVIDPVTPGINYEGTIMSVCSTGVFSTGISFTATSVSNLVWAVDVQSCEKTDAFGIVKTITGLSSPARLWQDLTSITPKVFVADFDDVDNGNVYWFNPLTATTVADMQRTTVVAQEKAYNNFIDTVYRRIYFVGAGTSGLIAYDIDTNTATTVAFGTNVDYNRQHLTVTDTRIYCNDFSTSLIIINRVTLAIISTVTIASITNPNYFQFGGFSMTPVGNELWVCGGAGGNDSLGDIGIFDQNLNYISSITLPGAVTWDLAVNNRFWQSSFYDKIFNRMYINDIGSNTKYLINTLTKTIISSESITNLEGKSNVIISWTINPINGKLLAAYRLLNNTSDITPITRMYEIDRTTNNYEIIYQNQYSVGLMPVIGAASALNAMGTNEGLVRWTSLPNAGTDGTITIYSNSLSGANTGQQKTDQLKQLDANNANTPTGLTKPNTPGPNYIAPVTNLAACPITYTLTCPIKIATLSGSVLDYEMSIVSSVKNNAAIAKIVISAYNVTTALVEGTPVTITAPFTISYFNGSFTGLTPSVNYTIKVEYFNVGNVVTQTCI